MTARWWPPARREIADLERQIDELATDRDDESAERKRLASLLDATESVRDELQAERDDLAARLARVTQSRNDLRGWIKAAYEPIRVGECDKLRYVHPADAERHIISLAPFAPGHTMHAYPCRRCPVHPGYRTAWVHVGHCRPTDPGAITLTDLGTALYGCGCEYGPSLDRFVVRCAAHADDGLREAS